MLPYILDERHETDTLFLIVEEDWRLFQTDQVPQEQRLSEFCGDSLSQSPGGNSQAASREESFSQSLAADFHDRTHGTGDEGKSTPSDPSDEGRHFARSLTKPKGAPREPAEPIKDIVRLCTYAHRKGHGDLVWLTWDGDIGEGYESKPRPSHGSTLTAVTQRFARWFKDHWSECHRGHLDCSLKHLLEQYGGEVTRSSFIVKSLGHYATHDSGILEEERRAAWTQWWVQEGVRMSQSPAHTKRELWTWTKPKCKTARVGIIPLENEVEGAKLRWRTFFQQDAKPYQKPDIPEEYPHGVPARDPPPPQPQQLTQEQMAVAFDMGKMVGAEEPTSQRQQRQRRSQLHQASLRVFTQVHAEVRI